MHALLRTLSVALAVSAAVACNPNVINGGDGGSGAGGSTGGGNTGGYNTGGDYTGGYNTGGYNTGGYNTGGYTGSGGTTTTSTSISSGCTGPIYEYCEGGVIYGECCQYGCPPPPEYCDLGNGTCYLGPCNGYPDGGPPCNPGTISASSFNQTCQSAADCIAVYQGDLCTDCLCPNAAINQGALSAYTTVLDADGPPVSTCGCPAIPPPTCTGGMCTLP
jgi:hypothetical protein